MVGDHFSFVTYMSQKFGTDFDSKNTKTSDDLVLNSN